MFRCWYLRCHFIELFWCLCLKLKNLWQRTNDFFPVCAKCSMSESRAATSSMSTHPGRFSDTVGMVVRASGLSWHQDQVEVSALKLHLWHWEHIRHSPYRKQQDIFTSHASIINCSSSCKTKANIHACLTLKKLIKLTKYEAITWENKKPNSLFRVISVFSNPFNS